MIGTLNCSCIKCLNFHMVSLSCYTWVLLSRIFIKIHIFNEVHIVGIPAIHPCICTYALWRHPSVSPLWCLKGAYAPVGEDTWPHLRKEANYKLSQQPFTHSPVHGSVLYDFVASNHLWTTYFSGNHSSGTVACGVQSFIEGSVV